MAPLEMLAEDIAEHGVQPPIVIYEKSWTAAIVCGPQTEGNRTYFQAL